MFSKKQVAVNLTLRNAAVIFFLFVFSSPFSFSDQNKLTEGTVCANIPW